MEPWETQVPPRNPWGPQAFPSTDNASQLNHGITRGRYNERVVTGLDLGPGQIPAAESGQGLIATKRDDLDRRTSRIIDVKH